MLKHFKILIFPSVKKNITNKNYRAIAFEFLFVDITKTTGEKKTQLRVYCPICDMTYTLKDSVADKNVMRLALKGNVDFYYDLIKDHCPKCHPENPINVDFWKI